MLASSLPIVPLSPQCGFKDKTAMRGIGSRKSVRKERCSNRSFNSTRSAVIAGATSLSGKCVVTNATRN